MTQTSLFDVVPPPESLPVQGRTVEARAASMEAAVHAANRRPRLALRYLDLLLRRGAHGATDHEAALVLECPVSSICSTRAGSQVKDQITPHGHRTGPYGERNTVYALRVAVGERFTGSGAERSPIAEAS